MSCAFCEKMGSLMRVTAVLGEEGASVTDDMKDRQPSLAQGDGSLNKGFILAPMVFTLGLSRMKNERLVSFDVA